MDVASVDGPDAAGVDCFETEHPATLANARVKSPRAANVANVCFVMADRYEGSPKFPKSTVRLPLADTSLPA